jgi:hypothetical protein
MGTLEDGGSDIVSAAHNLDSTAGQIAYQPLPDFLRHCSGTVCIAGIENWPSG